MCCSSCSRSSMNIRQIWDKTIVLESNILFFSSASRMCTLRRIRRVVLRRDEKSSGKSLHCRSANLFFSANDMTIRSLARFDVNVLQCSRKFDTSPNEQCQTSAMRYSPVWESPSLPSSFFSFCSNFIEIEQWASEKTVRHRRLLRKVNIHDQSIS